MKLSDLLRVVKLSPKDLEYLGIDCVKGWSKRNKDLEIPKDKADTLINRVLNKKKITPDIKHNLRELGYTLKCDSPQKLYLMTTNTAVKIGISKDPERRITEVNTGSRDKVYLVAVWDVEDDARYVEKYLHSKFIKHRTNGEWFNLNVTFDKVENNIPCKFSLVVKNEVILDTENKTMKQSKYVAYNKIKFETEKAILFDYFGQDMWIAKSTIVHHDKESSMLTVKHYTKIPTMF